MPRATAASGIEIEYETFGDPADPALLLVMGLGAQLLSWDVQLCESLVDRGFFVIRFDNRDAGLSTKIEVDIDLMGSILKAMGGEVVEAPYHLSDMADDAMAVLDDLGLATAHVVGASMGGMIAQTIAIRHRDRVQSLTSIMSTTGNTAVGQPTPEAMGILLNPPGTTRDEIIASSVASSRLIGSPDHFDEAYALDKATRAYDRCYSPKGLARQLLAIATSGDRTADLRQLDINALVIHGDVDPLVTLSGGEATAEAIDGSELLILEGMGHDLPAYYWPQVIEAITALASRSAVGV